MVHKGLWKDVQEEALSVESCTCCSDTLPFGPRMIVGVRLVRLGNGGSNRISITPNPHARVYGSGLSESFQDLSLTVDFRSSSSLFVR